MRKFKQFNTPNVFLFSEETDLLREKFKTEGIVLLLCMMDFFTKSFSVDHENKLTPQECVINCTVESLRRALLLRTKKKLFRFLDVCSLSKIIDYKLYDDDFLGKKEPHIQILIPIMSVLLDSKGNTTKPILNFMSKKSVEVEF
jgi:hypothetical protein